MLKLANLSYGLWMIAHSVEREVETRTEKYLKTVPQLPDKAAGQILGMADMILYANIHEEQDENGKTRFRRVLFTKPSKYFEAGDRSGALPAIIDLDYGRFAAAYNEGVTARKTAEAPQSKETAGLQKPSAPSDRPSAAAAPAKQ